jgi:lipopolysaccharide/colanic/teichoic acid biosynthesis glycosyltransferase
MYRFPAVWGAGMSAAPEQSAARDYRALADTITSDETAIRRGPTTHPGPFAVNAKRLLDIALAGLLLVIAFPLLLVCAFAIKLDDGGPVLFWQERVGRLGRRFWFPKFRSMCVGGERIHHLMLHQNDHGESITFKMRNDPRITRVGRGLRILSLDELPQFYSVLKGDMSLVGPRPPLPDEVARYSPTELRRLEVKPGLTCLWQVSGRSLIPFEEQVLLDIDYIERQSLWLDLELLARTVPAVLSCKGAF